MPARSTRESGRAGNRASMPQFTAAERTVQNGTERGCDESCRPIRRSPAATRRSSWRRADACPRPRAPPVGRWRSPPRCWRPSRPHGSSQVPSPPWVRSPIMEPPVGPLFCLSDRAPGAGAWVAGRAAHEYPRIAAGPAPGCRFVPHEPASQALERIKHHVGRPTGTGRLVQSRSRPPGSGRAVQAEISLASDSAADTCSDRQSE